MSLNPRQAQDLLDLIHDLCGDENDLNGIHATTCTQQVLDQMGHSGITLHNLINTGVLGAFLSEEEAQHTYTGLKMRKSDIAAPSDAPYFLMVGIEDFDQAKRDIQSLCKNERLTINQDALAEIVARSHGQGIFHKM